MRRGVETTITAIQPTTTMTQSNRRRTTTSLRLAKYIKNIKQANVRTAIEYEYRLSKFERYTVVFEKQQQQNQGPKIIATSLDQVIEKLKTGSNKIDPYDLLSGFVVYLQEEEKIENPNTLRHFVITVSGTPGNAKIR
jgi:hypothetical protein